MVGLLDAHKIDIPCTCGHKIKTTLGKVKKNPKITCPRCNTVISCNTDQISRVTNDIDKKISNLSGTLNIKL